MKKLVRKEDNLVHTKLTVSGFTSGINKTVGVLPVELAVGSKVNITSFSVIDTTTSYNALFELEVIDADHTLFMANVHMVDTWLYDEGVGPVKFQGIGQV